MAAKEEENGFLFFKDMTDWYFVYGDRTKERIKRINCEVVDIRLLHSIKSWGFRNVDGTLITAR